MLKLASKSHCHTSIERDCSSFDHIYWGESWGRGGHRHRHKSSCQIEYRHSLRQDRDGHSNTHSWRDRSRLNSPQNCKVEVRRRWKLGKVRCHCWDSMCKRSWSMAEVHSKRFHQVGGFQLLGLLVPGRLKQLQRAWRKR